MVLTDVISTAYCYPDTVAIGLGPRQDTAFETIRQHMLKVIVQSGEQVLRICLLSHLVEFASMACLFRSSIHLLLIPFGRCG